MIASTEQYKSALLQLRDAGRLRTTKYKEMLKAQYAMPSHTITTSQLAEAVGSKDFKGTNLKYGTMAFELAEFLGYEPPIRKSGEFMWFWTLSKGDDTSDVAIDNQYEIVMRPELVEALESLGWV